MIEYSQALSIAENYIEAMSLEIDGLTLILLESDTMEVTFGWVFFYTSKEFLETENYSYALAGNAPIIIDRQTGTVTVTGTA